MSRATAADPSPRPIRGRALHGLARHRWGRELARDLLSALRPPFEPAVIGVEPKVVRHIAGGRARWSRGPSLPCVAAGISRPSTSTHASSEIFRRTSSTWNQHLWSGQYGLLASALAGVPRVCVVHGALPSSSSSQRYLSICVARMAHRFVGVSDFVAAKIREELRVPRAGSGPSTTASRPPRRAARCLLRHRA